MTNCVNTNNMQVPYDRLRFIPTPNDIDFSSGFEDLLRKSSLKIGLEIRLKIRLMVRWSLRFEN